MQLILIVGIPCAIAMTFGIFMIRRVLQPWGGNRPRGLKQPHPDKLTKCPACKKLYHPSWGRICGACSGAA